MPSHRCGAPRAPRSVFALAAGALVLTAAAQPGVERVEGLHDHSPRWHAITEARLVLAPGKVIERGTLVMRDGLIVAVGAQLPVPAGARVWALPGRTVYAGFIDLASSLGVPAALRERPPANPRWGPGADAPPAAARPIPPLTGRGLAASNAMLRAEQQVGTQLELKADELKAARELGFTTVLAAPSVGIFRGQSALLNLGDGGDAKRLLLAERVAQHLGLDVDSGRAYPNSLMGSIALLRQTWSDARWFGQAQQAARGGPQGIERIAAHAGLAALQDAVAGRQPVFFAADDEQDYARIGRLREEFGFRLVLQGNGHEYRRAAQLKALGAPLLLPLNFPPAPELEQPDAALDVGLETLQHWEQAPSNAAYLAAQGLEFALSAHGLKEPRREFWPRLRQAVRRGLAPEQALAALTTVPARLVGESARLGSLEPGHLANLLVARGDLFRDEQAEPEWSFVDGQPYALEAAARPDLRGRWQLADASWQIGGSAAKPELSLGDTRCELRQQGRQLLLRLPCGQVEPAQWQQLVAELDGERLSGQLLRPDGSRLSWEARRVAPHQASEAAPPKAEALPPPPSAGYPAGALAETLAPRPAALLLRHATLWTSGPAGKLENHDLLVQDGKISAIGQDLKAPAGAELLELAGKHVSPGLIDAHSHTAIARGINEFSSSITAEVRVGDVLDATDINLYRELAGGLTTANLLHGSANTIGGQSQVIKLRWGQDAEALKFKGALPGIKFALGENVKQSWEAASSRYPQTRMGVEQLLRDAFQTARHYQRERARWQGNPKAIAEPRRDLQLETLVELLERKRAIHIHAYRADEILMFTRLAREFGLRVAAFQHVLEGYKVASEIASIGAGASTFSDWWTYKMEVQDAVPYNGVIMTRAGVLSSFNSDSDELARRLNTEAAKAVKYGGLSESEALKLVTINPARQLGVEQRVGSLEPGKDADFVIWSGPPLSGYSRAEQTWIDGRRSYSLARDTELRQAAERERQRLLAKALPERLAALQAAPAGRPTAAGGSPVRELLDWLALQNEVHQATRLRGSYWAGGAWHECTEDAP